MKINSMMSSPLDICMLQQMANEFLPEISGEGRDEDSGGSANTRILTEQDFLDAIAGDFGEGNNNHNIFPEHPIIIKNSFIESVNFGEASFWGNTSGFDVHLVRKDFPILNKKVNGKDLVWFDNAATTQKPKCVIDRLAYFYENENSNIHRGVHTLAARATDAYEDAREKAKNFLHASSVKEIVFVRGTTEAINLVAWTYGKENIHEGDEIVISWLEHHANIVPWQLLCAEKGAKLRVIPVDDDGQIDMGEYKNMLGPKTKLVAVTHVSNTLGTITPVEEMIELAHKSGAKVLVDGAQAVSHIKVDVAQLDADFYVFSGHKVFAPTGIGVLYGKEELLQWMIPYHGGGNMIKDVTFERSHYQDAPHRFEAGTGNIADAVGLGTAIDYVLDLGIDRIFDYEHKLLEYGTDMLCKIPGLRLIGTAKEKTGVLSFDIKGVSNEEIAKQLAEEEIALRIGHHCAQPIIRKYGVESTVRPSFAFYNTTEEIDRMTEVLKRLTGGVKVISM